MPNDSDLESITDLLQALDDVREAARRVDRERDLADDGRTPAVAAREPLPPEMAEDELLDF
jgi:hypothetical protein